MVDGWMGGWMDRWMDRWMDGWIDGWMMDGGMEGWMDGWMDGWIDGWMDGWTRKRNPLISDTQLNIFPKFSFLAFLGQKAKKNGRNWPQKTHLTDMSILTH